MNQNRLLFLDPFLRPIVWGGTRLRDDFGYDIPSETTGECWGISAHENGDCRVLSGDFAGTLLSELWRDHRELFGNLEGDKFPLLVKIIDARDDLSIQVHPDDAYAAAHENGSLGKTECWYILDCPEDGHIVIGHNAGSKEEARAMVEEKRWDDFIRKIPVHKGDFFQINPGCLHAICSGTLLLETQQNSDITYRVYDYDRLCDGKPRELHIEKSLDVIETPFHEVRAQETVRVGAGYRIEELYRCNYYTVEKRTIQGKAVFWQDKPFLNISVIEGQGTIDGLRIQKGTHLIVPSGYGEFVLDGNMVMMTSFV